MSEQIEHNCGVAAVVDRFGKRDVVPDALLIAAALEHRGQLSWGRAGLPLEGEQWKRHEEGFITHGVKAAITTDPRSWSVIAHTRYGTSGSRGLAFAHPVEAEIMDGTERKLHFILNGNVAHLDRPLAELKNAGIECRPWDTDVIAKLLGLRIGTMQGDVSKAIQSLTDVLDGAMNGVLQMPEGVYAFRDPHGLHPLVLGRFDDKVAIASEDRAISKAWGRYAKISDIEPGQLVKLGKHEPVIEQIWEPSPARCAFEWIYFANWLTTIDKASVQSARFQWGEMLAERDGPWDVAPYIVPVPDSAIYAGLGYRHKSKLRYMDELLAQGGRSFLQDGADNQKKKAKEKYDIDPNLVRGKPIVLIDDSIVRGNTMTELIQRIKDEAGPSEIHVRVACPAILNPCYYGIDMKTMQELLARQHFYGKLDANGFLPQTVLDAMARQIGVNSLKFIGVQDVPDALGIEIHDLCMACMTGEYPTPRGRQLYQLALEDFNEKNLQS